MSRQRAAVVRHDSANQMITDGFYTHSFSGEAPFQVCARFEQFIYGPIPNVEVIKINVKFFFLLLGV